MEETKFTFWQVGFKDFFFWLPGNNPDNDMLTIRKMLLISKQHTLGIDYSL